MCNEDESKGMSSTKFYERKTAYWFSSLIAVFAFFMILVLVVLDYADVSKNNYGIAYFVPVLGTIISMVLGIILLILAAVSHTRNADNQTNKWIWMAGTACVLMSFISDFRFGVDGLSASKNNEQSLVSIESLTILQRELSELDGKYRNQNEVLNSLRGQIEKSEAAFQEFIESNESLITMSKDSIQNEADRPEVNIPEEQSYKDLSDDSLLTILDKLINIGRWNPTAINKAGIELIGRVEQKSQLSLRADFIDMLGLLYSFSTSNEYDTLRNQSKAAYIAILEKDLDLMNAELVRSLYINAELFFKWNEVPSTHNQYKLYKAFTQKFPTPAPRFDDLTKGRLLVVSTLTSNQIKLFKSQPSDNWFKRFDFSKYIEWSPIDTVIRVENIDRPKGYKWMKVTIVYDSTNTIDSSVNYFIPHIDNPYVIPTSN